LQISTASSDGVMHDWDAADSAFPQPQPGGWGSQEFGGSAVMRGSGSGLFSGLGSGPLPEFEVLEAEPELAKFAPLLGKASKLFCKA